MCHPTSQLYLILILRTGFAKQENCQPLEAEQEGNGRKPWTDHFPAEELKPLQSPHSLRCGLDISIYDMCLATHLHGP